MAERIGTTRRAQRIGTTRNRGSRLDAVKDASSAFAKGAFNLVDVPFHAYNSAVGVVGSAKEKARDLIKQYLPFGDFVAENPLLHTNLPRSALPSEIPGVDRITRTDRYNTPTSNVTERVLEEMGAASMPSMAMFKMAQRAGPLSNALLRNIQANSGKVGAAEAASVLASGTASGTYREGAGEDYSPKLDLLLSMGAGVSPAIATSAASAARNTARTVLDNTTDAGVTRRAAMIAKDRASNPQQASQNLLDNAPLDQRINARGDIRRTSAQQAEDAGLAELEQTMANMSPELKGRIQAQNANNSIALRAELEATTPDISPKHFQDFLNGRVDGLIGRMKRRVGVAAKRARDSMDALDRGYDEIEASDMLHDELNIAFEEARQLERKLWSFPGKDAVIDMGQFKTQVKALYNQALERGRDPSRLNTDLMKVVKNLKSSDTAQKLITIRSDALDDIRRTPNMPEAKKAFLRQIADTSLEHIMREMPDSEMYRAAADYTRKMHQTFTQGQVGKLLKLDASGGLSTPTELTASGLSSGGGRGAALARQVSSIESPSANIAAEQALRAEAFSTLGETPSVKQINSFLKKRKLVLNEYPQLRGELESARKSTNILDIVSRRSERVERNIANSDIAKVLGDVDPGKGFYQAMRNSTNPVRTAKEMSRIASKQPDAINSLRRIAYRHFWDKIKVQMTTPGGRIEDVPSASKFQKAFTENKKWMKEIFTEDQMGRIKSILDEVETQEFASRAHSGSRPDFESSNLLGKWVGRIVGSRVGAHIGGPTPLVSAGIGADIAQRVLQSRSSQRIEEVLLEAVMDPKLMRELLTKDTSMSMLYRPVLPPPTLGGPIANINNED